MFAHIPLQAITLDLVDTHSVSLTVDHILTRSIFIPGQDSDTGSPPVEGTATPDTPLDTPACSSEDDDDNDGPHRTSEQPPDQRFSSHSYSTPGGQMVSSDSIQREESHDLHYEHSKHLVLDGDLSHDTEHLLSDSEQSSSNLLEISHDTEQTPCDSMESPESAPSPEPSSESSQTTTAAAALSGGLRQRIGGGSGLEQERREEAALANVSLFGSLQERKAELLRKARRYVFVVACSLSHTQPIPLS